MPDCHPWIVAALLASIACPAWALQADVGGAGRSSPPAVRAGRSSSPAVRAAEASPPGVPERCPRGIAAFASPFCAALVPTPDLPQVWGMLELAPVHSPFGVAVAPDGRLRHHLVARVESLPPPAALGDYTHYVAWGYDLSLGDERRLGVVGNGRTLLGELPHERFRLLVSAERSGAPARRGGRLVLRATSPSALLAAHRDAMGWLPAPAPAPASAGAGRGAGAGDAAHGAHDAHGAHAAGGWPPLPDDPRIAPSPMQHPPPSVTPFRMDTAGAVITAAGPRQVATLRDGDTLRLTAGFVRRQVGARTFVLYGYNGQVPGPLIRVRQGTEVVVRFINAIDLPSTIHWHGLRLDPQFDGVPHLSQAPVAPGDSFTYRLRFPDAGLYWYHPHVREDIQQELGLYGNLLVARRSGQRVPVHHEEVLALDDFLVGDDGAPYPLGGEAPSHALMGRFGNQLLVNGEPSYALQVARGAVVRFYLTNVASARTFNLRIPGARLKLVGTDLGDFEREEWVTSVVLAPAERYVVEARFDSAGRFALVNAVQWVDHMRGTVTPVQDTMGVVTVTEGAARPDLRASFEQLRGRPEVARELAPFRRHFDRPVDHELTLAVQLTGVSPATMAMLVGVATPVDWNDAMPMLNAVLSAHEVRWTMRDGAGRENMAIDWRFRAGQVARVRVVNDPTATHAMAHPIHFHGQRFLVITRNGVRTANLAWKDTAVVPAGETMDLLLDLSNPGRWMFHCHVSEHLGTGMMGTFTVLPPS